MFSNTFASEDILENVNVDNSEHQNHVESGDVLFTQSSETFEEVGMSSVWLHDSQPYLNSFCMGWRPSLECLNSTFMGYLLRCPTTRTQIIRQGQGISRINLAASRIADIKLCYPQADEQNKIAQFLKIIDNRIEKQQQLVDALKLYKRGVLQCLFKAVNGKVESSAIGDIFKVARGYVLPVSKIRPEPDEEYCYPVYSSQTKNDGLMGYYNQYLYENAITWTTDGANAGFVRFRKGKFYCTNVCGVLLNDNGFANEFIAEKLNSVTKYHVSYVGNPKLMNNVMAEIVIDYPTIELQEKHSYLISRIDKKIQCEYDYMEMLIKSKLALLQQMFI